MKPEITYKTSQKVKYEVRTIIGNLVLGTWVTMKQIKNAMEVGKVYGKD